MKTYHQAIKKEKTELLLLNTRMIKIQNELDGILKEMEGLKKENELPEPVRKKLKKEPTLEEGLNKENELPEPVVKKVKKEPTRGELEDFVIEHFDYLGTLEKFMEKHEEYIRELYDSDFEELKKWTDEEMGYLDSMNMIYTHDEDSS